MPRRKARFQVIGKLDSCGAPQEGTVTIDRRLGLFIVRPARRRRVYELPLADVATMVVWKVIRAELADRRADRKARRRAGKAGTK